MNDASNGMVIDQIQYGTHETRWDLSVLFHKGAAAVRKDKVQRLINSGHFPEPSGDRVSLVKAIFEVIATKASLGASRNTVLSCLETTWRFFRWCDDKDIPLSEESAVAAFMKYADHLKHSALHEGAISLRHAHGTAKMLSNILGQALHVPGDRPGSYLLGLTNFPKKGFGSRKAFPNRPPVEHDGYFEFGELLKQICDSLDFPTVAGSLPIRIALSGSESLLLTGNLIKPDLDPDSISVPHVREAALARRAPLPTDIKPVEVRKRSSILNLRIESELMMFIAQTGMNLAQASSMRREPYRWQTVGDELLVFRVYKGRRSGEAVFRCFRSYREHLNCYIDWLDQVGLSIDYDQRLFPVISRGMNPAAGAVPNFYALKKATKSVGIEYISPQRVRSERINWLLSFTNDPETTADLAAHSSSVLLQDYARPDVDAAIEEISLFNKALDQKIRSAGPGICSDPKSGPRQIEQSPTNIPAPDCTNADGCLFCDNYRDILSYDYCWKLASHCKLKELELSMNPPYIDLNTNPAKHVVDRLTTKLEAIARVDSKCASWVNKARNQIRSSVFHPEWESHITVLEELA